MPLLGRISELARESLIEAKLIKGEEGPIRIKRYVEQLKKKSKTADKTEICRLSNYDVFLPFLILSNDELLTYEETINYCEESKKAINAWTFAKEGEKLSRLIDGLNNDGSLKDLRYTQLFSELGLTPVLVSYNTKAALLCMYEFLKLKRDLLNPLEYTKKLPLAHRVTAYNNIYKKSTFSGYVQIIIESFDDKMEDHEYRQDTSQKRINATNEVIKKLEDESIESIEEVPANWHMYLEAHLLEAIYDLVLQNLGNKKRNLDKEQSELLSKRNKTELTTYLYSHKLDPYSLGDKLTELESIPNIVSRLEFFKFLEISIPNILTKYYEYLISITEEQLKYLNFLISNGVLTSQRLRNNLNIIGTDYQKIIANYEIIKDIIDFKSVFYNDSILLKDITEIKSILSILKEYTLTKSNYIFLLCNFNYLPIYDLIIENNIPESLFISICETENPLNTIKRILIYMNIGESFVTPGNFLKKDVTSSSKFICDDDSLDDFVPNTIQEQGLNLLSGKSITTITSNPIVRYLDEEYRIDDVYFIGSTSISRAKFLRNFESVSGNPEYMIISLVSNSILSDSDYYKLLNELKGNKQLKK